MKLTSKKATNCSYTTTTLNPNSEEIAENTHKLLHILQTKPNLYNATSKQLARPEEREKLDIELEQRRNQGRIYAGIFPPR